MGRKWLPTCRAVRVPSVYMVTPSDPQHNIRGPAARLPRPSPLPPSPPPRPPALRCHQRLLFLSATLSSAFLSKCRASFPYRYKRTANHIPIIASIHYNLCSYPPSKTALYLVAHRYKTHRPIKSLPQVSAALSRTLQIFPTLFSPRVLNLLFLRPRTRIVLPRPHAL